MLHQVVAPLLEEATLPSARDIVVQIRVARVVTESRFVILCYTLLVRFLLVDLQEYLGCRLQAVLQRRLMDSKVRQIEC